MDNEFDHEGNPDSQSSPKKPQSKHFKDTSKRLRQGKSSHLGNRASLDWRLDARAVCGAQVSGKTVSDSIYSIYSIIETLRQSRTGSALLDEAEATGAKIVYDAQHPVSQYYPGNGTPFITLNPHRPRGDMLVQLARELRRLWQHRRGALANPLQFEPDEAILVNRAQAADAFMIGVKVAWELKLSGVQDAWNHIAGSPLADIGRSFELRARNDFRTLNTGSASRIAYDKFFENSRTKSHDKAIIHQMLLDENGYMRERGGKPRVSPELFLKLGEMPAGCNYFSARAARQPTDASYAAVDDRSNANFLWFIKFERNFQERELQMVKESVKLSAEIVDFARWAFQHKKPTA